MRTLVFWAALALPSVAQAQHFCTEPMPPGCVMRMETYEDEYSFDRCRRDLDSYRQDVVNFSQCMLDYLDREAENLRREKDAAVLAYEENIRFFNCRARDPDAFCPPP